MCPDGVRERDEEGQLMPRGCGSCSYDRRQLISIISDAMDVMQWPGGRTAAWRPCTVLIDQ